MITIIPWARISSKANLLEKKTFEPQCLTTIIWYISEGYFIVIALPKALWLSKGQMISLRIVEDSFDHHSKSQELLVILQLISMDVLSRETTSFVPDIYISEHDALTVADFLVVYWDNMFRMRAYELQTNK